MLIAIHGSPSSFSDRWIDYCKEMNIPYKIVNCFRNNIFEQLSDCDALMWHFSQNDPKANLIAKQILYSVEASGRKVFPDFYSSWHFDDKIGQKYLLEGVNAPIVPSWIFYSKKEALAWAAETEYPIVFKLRVGSSSHNVLLVRNIKKAYSLINKSFGVGIPSYNPQRNLKERWRKFKLGKTNLLNVIQGLVRLFIPPRYSRVRGREKGYVYFQQYIPGNDSDFRVIVIGNKAFAIKRFVRDNDFRASGSGQIVYDRNNFNELIISHSFELAEKLNTQCIAFDFLFDNGHPLITEVSYGFSPEGYDPCPGFWDKDLKWHEGPFNPYGWMVTDLIEAVKASRHE